MSDSRVVRLEGKALALADAMVRDGTCESLDEAVARSLAIASLHDADQERMEAGIPAEHMRESLRDIDRDVEAGLLGDDAPLLWQRIRAAVAALAEGDSRLRG